MSMFPASQHTKMNELCTTIIDYFDINRVGQFDIIFDRFSRDFVCFHGHSLQNKSLVMFKDVRCDAVVFR